MLKKFLGIAVFLLYSFNAHNLYADEMESKFKEVSLKIAVGLQVEKEFLAKGLAGESAKQKVADAERNLAECQNELRNLVKANPQSIWADDAQYIIATLSAKNPEESAVELEYLLKNYPNTHMEDWTKENLTIIMPNPNIPFDELVRLQLCSAYKQLGDIKKLQELCAESIKKYPDKAEIFEKILQE